MQAEQLFGGIFVSLNTIGIYISECKLSISVIINDENTLSSRRYANLRNIEEKLEVERHLKKYNFNLRDSILH